MLINFVDFKAAFDSVHRSTMWKVLDVYGIALKLINILKSVYHETTCAVRSEGALSEWFAIISGVRQGDIWSTIIFGIVIDFILRQSLDKSGCGLTLIPRRSSRYPAVQLPDLDFADDLGLLESSEERMQFITDLLRVEAAKFGLVISFDKTKLLAVGETPRPSVTLGDQGTIKVAAHFKYLGSFVTDDGTMLKELGHRLARAASAFKDLSDVLRQRSISVETKVKIYSASVLTQLLYACESWTLKSSDESRIDAFDMRCQRRILRVTWKDKISNERIRARTKQPQLTEIIRTRRLRWFGHLHRLNDTRLPKRIYKWLPQFGRRRRGRPRTRWKDCVVRDLELREAPCDIDDAEIVATNRINWRKICIGGQQAQ